MQNNRPTRILWMISLVSVLVLGACSPNLSGTPAPNPTTPEPLQMTDGLGRTVTLPGPAQRIVSMAASNTEILYAIGAGSQVVGRDEFSDYPAEAVQLPSIAGGFGEYNLEEIVNLKPDLVLAAEINTPEQVKAVEDLGLTVYYLSNPATIDEMYEKLMIVARLTGRESKAAALIESLKARVAEVQEKIAPLSAMPTVFYELDATDPNAPFTAGEGTFVDALIQMAGGSNVAHDLGSGYFSISGEELLVQNPMIILLGDAAYGVTAESVAARPGWKEMAAVENKQVYAFDDNLVSRPGPRLVDGLEAMARLIHPGAFE